MLLFTCRQRMHFWCEECRCLLVSDELTSSDDDLGMRWLLSGDSQRFLFVWCREPEAHPLPLLRFYSSLSAKTLLAKFPFFPPLFHPLFRYKSKESTYLGLQCTLQLSLPNRLWNSLCSTNTAEIYRGCAHIWGCKHVRLSPYVTCTDILRST